MDVLQGFFVEFAGWGLAVGVQVYQSIFDETAPTLLNDGFLAEMLVIVLAYVTGRLAQRSSDRKSARRVAANDVIRDFEDLWSIKYLGRHERPAARARGVRRLKDTLAGIPLRVRASKSVDAAVVAFANALTGYQDAFEEHKHINSVQRDAWTGLAEKHKAVVQVLVRRPDEVMRSKLDELAELQKLDIASGSSQQSRSTEPQMG